MKKDVKDIIQTEETHLNNLLEGMLYVESDGY